MDAKSPLLSKTLWANLLCSIAPFIPGTGGWIENNPELFGLGLGVLNIGLRLITKQPVDLKVLEVSKKF
jgi:hypothetical protein